MRNQRSLIFCILASVGIHLVIMMLPAWLVSPIIPTSPIPKAFVGRELAFKPDFRLVEVSVEKQATDIGSTGVKLEGPEAAQVNPLASPNQWVSRLKATIDLPSQIGDLSGKNDVGKEQAAKDDLYSPPVPSYLALPDLFDHIADSISVEIEILVGADGNPLKISFGDALLDQEIRSSIVSAVNRSRFEPAKMGGVAVESWLHLSLKLKARRP